MLFATEGERLEITHKASSRMTFAKGRFAQPCGWMVVSLVFTTCRTFWTCVEMSLGRGWGLCFSPVFGR